MKQNPLIHKLRNVIRLTDADVQAVLDLCDDVREIPAKADIIGEGERPDHVHLVLSGWAARYKIVNNGDRQITAFLIPGDFCDMHIAILSQMDHSIAALTDCAVAYIPSETLDRLTQESNNLTRALWWTTLLDEAILREWVVNNGKRNAHAAMAHLICEMRFRAEMVGLVRENAFDFPITQEDLASATGLTSVHINRVLKRLRQEGLIDLHARRLTVLDAQGLGDAAGFEPAYFHLRRRNDGGIER